MQNKIKLLNAKCVGGYNDTIMYDILINFNGKDNNIKLNKSFNKQLECDVWYIDITDLQISIKEKYSIIDTIVSNLPSIMSDTKPKEYNININCNRKNKYTEIISVEEQFSKLNNLSENDNIYRVINNCSFILDGIDYRNSRKTKKEKNEEYPEWATKENIELIEKWSRLQREKDFVIDNENIQLEDNEESLDY